jgi:phosphatidate cytidylyltransferase
MALQPVEAFDPFLRERLVSSVVLVAGTLLAVLAGGWWFGALAVAAALIMAEEWARLAADRAEPAWLLAAAAAAVPSGAAVLAVMAGASALALACVLLAAPLAAGLSALLLLPGGRPDRVAGGVLYVGLPVLAMVWLRNDPAGGLPHLLWLLLVVWATDICAYLVGRSVGGPKLAPRISPGKTWSGLLGGMTGAGLLGAGLAPLAVDGFWRAAALGAALAVVAQAGDLFESALKRRAGVKDSGHLIPGHGGLLDRIDGLVFAAPVFAGVVWLSERSVPS